MVNLAEKDKWTGIVGCQSVYPDGTFQNAGGYLKGWELRLGIKDLMLTWFL